ncbi:hypothetical protein J1N35_016773 [Gossypium stocksii]|uniref:Uncharacterized protein n=1 Tax=Gossypium stocksii TaxID=47602 RepID=A0A9D4A5K2_9ROSI|nr:hypothetical protein J1N35_016773 [Gossypium stocksii]
MDDKITGFKFGLRPKAQNNLIIILKCLARSLLSYEQHFLKKIAQMIQQEGVKIQKEDDIESVYSIEDGPSDRTISAIPVYPDEVLESESDYSDVHMILAQSQV